jgi:hypothetical protein
MEQGFTFAGIPGFFRAFGVGFFQRESKVVLTQDMSFVFHSWRVCLL